MRTLARRVLNVGALLLLPVGMAEASQTRLPLHFEANRGQTDPKVQFISRGKNSTLFLTSQNTVLRLHRPGRGNAVIRMQLVGASPGPRVSGLDKLPGTSNYFIGNDPAAWHRDIPHYARVHYKEVYPGIDLMYYESEPGGMLEYDFIVAPEAPVEAIAFSIDGAESIAVDGQGDLVLGTMAGEVRLRKPVAHQSPGDSIEAHFVLRDEREVGFEVAAYDRTRPLTIDPVLVYSSYLGDNGADDALGVGVDDQGNAYAMGVTGSVDFPTTAGSFDEQCAELNPCNFTDAFVAKIDVDGSGLVYSTFLGGDLIELDRGGDIAVDGAGNAYVVGSTTSVNFPTTPAAWDLTCGTDGNCNIVRRDVFVTQLNPAGNGLIFSTYLGGSDDDWGNAINLDPMANVVVTGATESNNFPSTPGAFAGFNLNGTKTFVAKLDPAGASLLFSTSLGVSSTTEEGMGVGTDAVGAVYVTGQTTVDTFPTTIGAFLETRPGDVDAFVTKLEADGSDLVYSTFLGDVGFEEVEDIAVDASGFAHVGGVTSSPNFPTTPGVFQETIVGLSDAFVTKFNADGTDVLFSTFLGGNADNDRVTSIALDANGDVYVAGLSQALDFPVTPDALVLPAQRSGSRSSAFVSKLSADGSTLLSSTRLGGSATDLAEGIAVDASGDVYVVGSTESGDFLTTPGAFQTMGNLQPDAFVSKLSVPEPSARLLLAIVVGCLVGLSRRRRNW